MKNRTTKRTTKRTLIAFAASFLTSVASGSLGSQHVFSVAHADDTATTDTRRHHRGEIPPELAAKLTLEQQSELKAATSMEERMALLKSWNIELPARRDHGHRHVKPDGPPNVSAALKTLFDETRDASTDADRETARQSLRQYYKTTTDDADREAIRGFFARHPSTASGTGSSPSNGSAPSVSR